MFDTQSEQGQDQEQEQQTTHALDMSIDLEEEQEGVSLFLDEISQAAPANEVENQNSQNQSSGQSSEQESESAFDDEQEEQEQETDEDKLIQQLKAKGFKVEKEEVVNEDQVFNDKLKMYDDSLAKSNAFLALNDDKIVEEKVKFDLMTKYRTSGRSHLINTEEFELEAEAELDTYQSNDALKKIYADNIRRDVRDGVVNNTNAAKKALIDEQTKKIDTQISEKKTQLRNSFNDIYKQGMLGMKFEKEDIQKAFDYISTGKFSNEIKNDPNSLAELALYRLNRDKIVGKIGGPTYGEGVRDTVKGLNGVNNKSASHISNAMQSSAGRSQKDVISRDWGSVLDPNSDEAKDKKII